MIDYRDYFDVNPEEPFERWIINTSENNIFLGDYMKGLLGLKNNTITIANYMQMVHEDYRSFLADKISSTTFGATRTISYPLQTPLGYVWIETQLADKSVLNNNNSLIDGKLRFLPKDRIQNFTNNNRDFNINDTILQHRNISNLLHSFLKTNNIDDSINDALNDILHKLGGEKVYIFEYDLKKRTQNCTFEVTASERINSGDNIKKSKYNEKDWLTAELLKGNPIQIENVTQTSNKQSFYEKGNQLPNITSLMVAPLFLNGKVSGYIGIDTVNEVKKWEKIDYEYFSTLANLISVFIKLRQSAKSLELERKHLSSLFHHMPMGYISISLQRDKNGKAIDFTLEDANLSAIKTLEIDEKLHIGIPTSKLNTEYFQEHLNSYDKIESQHQTLEKEIYLSDCDRHIRTINYTLIKGEVITLFFDITDNIKVREALTLSKDELSKIYKNIPIGIEVYDKDGYLLDINDIEMDIFGIEDKSKVIGLNLFANPNLPKEEIEKLKLGEDVIFEIAYDFQRAKDEYYDNKLDGVKRITCKCTTLLDSEQNIENYLLIVIDNTEIHNAYGTIRETDSIFEYLGQFAGIGYFKWDLLKEHGSAFEQWFRNFGEEINHSRNLIENYENIHKEDMDAFNNYFVEVKKGKAVEFQRDMRVWNGLYWNWARCNIKVRNYDPKHNSIIVVGVNIDITEHKQTHENLSMAKIKAEESDRLKSAFLANMSHEIRTPLNAIVGFSNIIAESTEDADMQTYISIIQQNNNILLQLISDILDISKIESGIIEIVEQEMSVNELCKNIAQSLQLKTAQGIEVVCETPLHECIIVSDRNKLQQVLSNFANNAAKFTKCGHIKIGYKLNSEEIEFYVSDTGIGVSNENLSRIFERFVKLDSFVTGTGLGLPICKSIIERMDGKIGVKSEIDKGSYFYFTLPVHRVNPIPTELSAIENKKYTALFNGAKPTILVAEDNESNFMLINAILKKEYVITHALNGRQAIEAFDKNHPNLVLMDINMPVMNGFEALEEILKRNTKIPVIALTAFAFDSDKQKALNAGFSDYITKPINSAILHDKIREILKHNSK